MATHAKRLVDLLATEDRRRLRLVGGLNATIFGALAVATLAYMLARSASDRATTATAFFVGGWSVAHVVGGAGAMFGRRWAVLLLWSLAILDLVGFPILTVLGGYTLWVLYDTREQTRIAVRAFLASAAVPAFLAVLVVAQAVFPNTPGSPLERQLLAAVEAEGGQDEFQRWRRTLPEDVEEAATAIGSVVNLGLLRLATGDQLTRVQLLSDGLSRISVVDCAALARGHATWEQQQALVAQFDSSELSQWSEVAARALLAHLRKTPPPRVASQGDVSEYTRHLYQSLPDADGRRLDGYLESPTGASDADACWFTRLWYSQALQPDSSRPRWLNVVITLSADVAP